MIWTEICQQLWWLRNSRPHPKSPYVWFGPYFLCGRRESLPVKW